MNSTNLKSQPPTNMASTGVRSTLSPTKPSRRGSFRGNCPTGKKTAKSLISRNRINLIPFLSAAEIDALVYELYGLTEEEIGMVEATDGSEWERG